MRTARQERLLTALVNARNELGSAMSEWNDTDNDIDFGKNDDLCLDDMQYQLYETIKTYRDATEDGVENLETRIACLEIKILSLQRELNGMKQEAQ